jgi:hypothetical protein
VFKFYVAPIILSRYWNFHQSNQTCDLAGARVNQAAGRIRPAGRQLAIADLRRLNHFNTSVNYCASYLRGCLLHAAVSVKLLYTSHCILYERHDSVQPGMESKPNWTSQQLSQDLCPAGTWDSVTGLFHEFHYNSHHKATSRCRMHAEQFIIIQLIKNIWGFTKAISLVFTPTLAVWGYS